MIKLTLIDFGELDIDDNVNIPLNWSINSITDISTRNSAFSKTIKLKGTANNNLILGQAFDVNNFSLRFDPLKKAVARLTEDGITIFEGVFQLAKVYRDYSTADSVIYYDVYLKSNTNDLFTIIDSKYLEDIDLSVYTHRWTLPHIERNMKEGNYLHGYQYWLGQQPLTNYPVNSNNYIDVYSPRDMKPAIYVATILDAIFGDAGYTYEFPEFFNINFDKLIIPFNGEKLPSVLEGGPFRAGSIGLGGNERLLQRIRRPGGNTPIFNSIGSCGFQVPNTWNGCPGDATCVPFGVNSAWNAWSITPASVGYLSDLEFNDETTAPDFYDPTNSYNPLTGIYTLDPSVQTMYFEAKIRIIPKVTFENLCYSPIPTPDGSGPFGPNPWEPSGPVSNNTGVGMMTAEELQTNIWSNSTVIFYTLDIVLFAVDINGIPVSPGIPFASNSFFTTTITADQRFGLNTPFQFTGSEGVLAEVGGVFSRSSFPTAVGVRAFIRSSVTKNNPGPWYGFWCDLSANQFMPFGSLGNSNTPFTPANAIFSYEQVDTVPAGYFRNSNTDDIAADMLIDPTLALPKEVKQSDFLIGLVRLYNLYIYDDDGLPNNIIIKTRDRFYADGGQLDWTDRIDRRTIETELLSHKLQKINIFKYSDDSDEVNEAYENKTGKTFGELKYIFKNEFISGDKDISPIFSPTPMIHQYKKNVPYINSRNPENNIRILMVGDLFTSQQFWFYNEFYDSSVNSTNIVGQSYWRHVGHLYPNSYEPQEDINFGVCEYYAHNFNTITDNNLFNRFWRKQYTILEEGHMLTAMFYLQPTDLQLISRLFAKRIYINDSWWNINKIIDYIPGRGLTKVELITADSRAPEFVANNNLFIRQQRTPKPNFNQFMKVGGDPTTGEFNGKFDGGKSNDLTDSKRIMALGDNNVANASNSLIVGSKNKVNGNNVVAIGVNGSRMSGKATYIGRPVAAVNIISGGRDEILSPFGDNNILLLSGGRDKVLPLGSATITHQVISDN